MMNNKIEIKVKRLNNDFNDIPIPEYATEGSSGMDVRAAVKEDMIIHPPKSDVQKVPQLQPQTPAAG